MQEGTGRTTTNERCFSAAKSARLTSHKHILPTYKDPLYRREAVVSIERTSAANISGSHLYAAISATDPWWEHIAKAKAAHTQHARCRPVCLIRHTQQRSSIAVTSHTFMQLTSHKPSELLKSVSVGCCENKATTHRPQPHSGKRAMI